MIASRFGIACAFAFVATAACTDLESNTNLNPDGPPMLRQVRMHEKVVNPTTGALTPRLDTVFAFGTHPNVTSVDEAHPVTSANAYNNPQRLIMDELLIGNNLEEILCNDVVDSDAYSAVPLGATPDDIARCATATDVLPKTCPGSNPLSVCICKNDGGCLHDGKQVAKGDPVGVKDSDKDGAADDSHFIVGAVHVKCGNIDVPTDADQSYWYPSGNQEVPATGGFDALGPAIVLWPARPPNAPMSVESFYPTNLECGLVFDSSVVDKQNIGVCAPPDGDVTQNCTPGDVSKFKFKVEPLNVASGSLQGATGVPRTLPQFLTATAAVDPTSLTAAVTVNPAVAGMMVTMNNQMQIKIDWGATGLAASTMYTLTIGTGLKDYYGQAMPQPVTFTFTSAP